MTLRTLAVAAVATLALTGCTGGGTDATAHPSPTASSNRQAALALAECMRANGHPNFPDPVQDDRGRWYFPTDTIGDWDPAEACRDLVHDWKIAFSDQPAVRSQDLAKLREFAACMRQHGFEDFPDPTADGSIELPERLRTLDETQDPTFTAAYRACQSLLPPKATGKDGS
jgi:hypothetical protein